MRMMNSDWLYLPSIDMGPVVGVISIAKENLNSVTNKVDGSSRVKV